MIKDKKSEVEMETIIKIILIVASLAIIIGIISLLGLTGKIDKEACHASVLARSVPIASGITKQAINLRCKTEHVCITLSGSGKGCSAHDVKFQIKPGSELEIQRQIQEEVAGQFFDCWWMLGEGRLNFFDESIAKNAGFGITQSGCVICSVITFDDEIKTKFRKVAISNYLETEKIPGKDETFLQYFTSDEGDALLTKINGEEFIDTTKEYSITFMGIKSLDFTKLLAQDIGAIALATISTNFLPGGSGIIKAAWTLIKAHPVATAVVALVVVSAQAGLTIQSYVASAAHCEGDRKGCSMLVFHEYNAEELGKSCGNIESIP